MLWLPFAATALYAWSVVQRKQFLKTSRIPFEIFFPSTLMLIALMSVLVAPLDWHVDPVRAYEPLAISLLVIAIVLGVFWFEHFYRALREESLSRYDLLVVLEPIAAIALVSIVFPAERDVRIWIAGAVACMALYLGHRNHRVVRFDHGERNLLLAIGLSAIIVLIQRYLLTIYSPLALNAMYMCGVAWLFAFKYGIDWYRQGVRLFPGLLLTALLIVSNSVLYLYSYKALGVTVTTLVMLLEPIAVGLIAYRLYKEPVKPKLLGAGLVVLATVIYAVWLVGSR